MLQSVHHVIYSFVSDHLLIHVVLILLSSLMLIASMGVDLYFGVKKAKQNGEARTSTGFKKTCDKARKYFSPYMVLVCIDLIGCVIIPVPAFSMIWAAYCIFCEFTSVREKSWQKAELRKAERTVSMIIENKDDIAKLVADLILKVSEEQETKKNKP